MEGEHSEIVGEAASCSVEVHEQEWKGVGYSAVQLTDDLVSVSMKSDRVMRIELGLSDGESVVVGGHLI